MNNQPSTLEKIEDEVKELILAISEDFSLEELEDINDMAEKLSMLDYSEKEMCLLLKSAREIRRLNEERLMYLQSFLNIH